MARDFRDGNDGEALRQGDTIRTSVTGFAELAYFDGSFTRIDSAAEWRWRRSRPRRSS